MNKPHLDTPQAGDRVRIHPASDWFMRGETYATVVSYRNGKARVIGDRSGRRFTLVDQNILELIIKGDK